MTTTNGTQGTLSFNVSTRHAGLRLLAIAGLYGALALGFLASVEQTSRRPTIQATEVSTAPAPVSSPAGAAVALR
jgi:hypothetical protein